MCSFRRDARGFTGAEKALLICFALAAIILGGALARRGSEQAADDAARTLRQRGGPVSGLGRVIDVAGAEDVRAPAGPPPAAPVGRGGGGKKDPPAATSSLPDGTGLANGYQIGPPRRPDIHHDNGFLQNPNDPNDPKPLPTVEPTRDDWLNLAKWEAKLRLAQAAQGIPFVPHNDIPDGLDTYDHFLHGDGKDRHFDYNRFVENDDSGKVVLQNATSEMQQAAEDAYRKMIEKDPSLKGKPITFQVTGPAIHVGGSDGYPYPATENWQKAIGGHALWTSATITVTPPADGQGAPRFDMRLKLNAEDRYNFNPGAADIATGTPDAENGRFEQTGLGHQYMNYGSLERDVKWDYGHTDKTTSKKVDTSGR